MTAPPEDPLWMLETPPPKANARIRYGDGPYHFADLRLPKGSGPFPVIVVIHGGFWRAKYDLEHVGHLADDLARRGYATWSIEYRRIGHDGGGVPGTLQDVGRAIDHLPKLAAEHRLDLKRVLTLGHSAGGHLAVWAAARHRISDATVRGEKPLPIHGVVSLAGVVDLPMAHALGLSSGVVRTFVGGTPEEKPELYRLASPSLLVPIGVPQVHLHGTADDIVPIAISERFVDAAKKAGDQAALVRLEGAGHFEVINPRAKEWEAIVEAVRSLLLPQ